VNTAARSICTATLPSLISAIAIVLNLGLRMENVRRKLLRGSRVSVSKLSVLGSEIAYPEAGGREKPVALFLHGNPTSSYIWRNILPLVAEVAHRVTPDLIGFGQFRPGGRGLYRGG